MTTLQAKAQELSNKIKSSTTAKSLSKEHSNCKASLTSEGFNRPVADTSPTVFDLLNTRLG